MKDGKAVGAIQPNILFQDHGKLQAVGRTKNERLFSIWSDVGGWTWGRMTLTDLPNPDSGADAVTWRDARQQRERLAAGLGMEDAPDAPSGFAYPTVIQTRDGLVQITYTWERKLIKHVVLDPARLGN